MTTRTAVHCTIMIIFFGSIHANLLPKQKTVHWALDQRHILLSWPPATIAWLESYAPPEELKRKLDSIFTQPILMEILSCIYRDYFISPEQMEILQQAGFTFLGGKLNIFEIKAIPGYVLKMAGPRNGHPELLNLGRIVLAEKVRKNADSWHMKSVIKVPKKYAYVTSLLETVAYLDQPKIIVVAEKIPASKVRAMTLRHRLLKLWLSAKRIPDLRTRNMLATTTGLALIDTEPWNKPVAIPGLTKLVTINHFKTQHSQKCIDIFQTQPHDLENPGKTGITAQGLIVHQTRTGRHAPEIAII